MSIVTYNNRSIRNISSIPGAAKSLIHIKTLTASSSSTISFVNGSSDVVLDSTYPIYLFKYITAHPATDEANFKFQGSTNSGSSYGVTMTSTKFRSVHLENDSYTTLSYEAAQDLAQSTNFHNLHNGVGNENDEQCSGELFLFNPSSTTFVKHYMSVASEVNAYNIGQNGFGAGYFNTTSAINAIQFKMSSGNIDAGDICLYGIN